MNPLCCIAPVSIDRDSHVVPVKARSPSNAPVGLDYAGGVRHLQAPMPAAAGEAELGREAEEAAVAEGKGGGGSGGGVAGILYKWVNYGKGWRSRWFVLEDGVLSYYKVRGPDKISVSAATEKGVRVIGEDSMRRLRKCSLGNGVRGPASKRWKPVGEIHLKVWFLTLSVFVLSLFWICLKCFCVLDIWSSSSIGREVYFGKLSSLLC